MKSTKKNLILTVLLLSLLLSVVALDPVSVSAKVTMPAKSSVLVKNTTNYITKCMAQSPKKSWTKLKMNNKTCFDAISYICDQCDHKDIFKSEGQLHTYCYDYFGRTGYKNVTTGGYFYKQGNRVVLSDFCKGDWGESWPECKITKKKKVKSGIYDVYVTCYFRTDAGLLEPGENPLRKEGDCVIRIKKNSKSRFGYVVTGIKYKSA